MIAFFAALALSGQAQPPKAFPGLTVAELVGECSQPLTKDGGGYVVRSVCTGYVLGVWEQYQTFWKEMGVPRPCAPPDMRLEELSDGLVAFDKENPGNQDESAAAFTIAYLVAKRSCR